MLVTHPTWQRTSKKDDHIGWVFRDPHDPPVTPLCGHGSIDCDGCVPPPKGHVLSDCKTVRDIYDISAKSLNMSTEKTIFSVPVLFDSKTKTIVNNESSEILRMFNDSFASLEKEKTIDLYPSSLRQEIDDVNEWVYHNINNGVYKAGFAKSQDAYNTASAALNKHLLKVETILSKQRYICNSSTITEADVRLFMTLVRFDEVYVVYFKCNTTPISTLPNTLNYCREMYQIPEIQKTIHMDHIKNHYFTSHASLNTYAIVPVGPDVIKDLSKPHDRAKRFPVSK